MTATLPDGLIVVAKADCPTWRLDTEFVPTLIRVENGQEVARTHGRYKEDWRAISGLPGLGEDLPEMRHAQRRDRFHQSSAVLLKAEIFIQYMGEFLVAISRSLPLPLSAITTVTARSSFLNSYTRADADPVSDKLWLSIQPYSGIASS